MPQNQINIDMCNNYSQWDNCEFDILAQVTHCLNIALVNLHKRKDAQLPDNIADMCVSIVLSDDIDIRALNKQYRNKDKPTNVLSFPMLDFDEDLDGGSNIATDNAGEMNWPDFPGFDDDDVFHEELGDIIISFDTTMREAQEQSKSFQNHFTHLILHGFLHLLGYDHIEDDEAQEMETTEISILAELGIENPYI